MKKSLGFWSLLSLVIGSQIGSGIFVVPSGLSRFGTFGLFGWLYTGIGVLCLAFIFGKLSIMFPKADGIHSYVEEKFGKKIAFFIAWTYWIVSWISSAALVFTISGAIGRISQLSDIQIVCIELGLIFSVTFSNLFGIKESGNINIILTVLKLSPLILLPILCFSSIDYSNFSNVNPTGEFPLIVASKAAMLALWGFVGLECAIAPSGILKDSKKTIPRAIMIGTWIVLFTYVFNTFIIFGLVPREILMHSPCSHAEIAKIVFGTDTKIVISLMIIFAAYGALNTWTLVSSQISYGGAQSGFLPKFLAKLNKREVPHYGILIATLGQIPFILLSKNKNFVDKIMDLIDFSAAAFLLIYLIASITFLKVVIEKKLKIDFLVGIVGCLFCFWTLLVSFNNSIYAMLIPISGFPVYLYMKAQKIN